MKKNVAKRICALLLIGVMVLATACSSNSNSKNDDSKKADSSSTTKTDEKVTNTDSDADKQAKNNEDRPFNDDGTFPVCKEKTKLTILICENSGVEDYATNTMTKMLEEDGNFELEFISIPSSDFKTKVNLMIAGDDELPDIIACGGSSSTRFSDVDVYNFALAGAIVPLTEYYKNAYYINDAVKRTGVDYLKLVTSPDGELYGIPTYNQSISNENPSKMYVYKEWLDKLNLEVPTTPEEFYQMLKAFKEKDPNGNGLQDEIPLISYAGNIHWFQWIMNAFQYSGNKSTDFLVVNDGKLSVAYNTEGYREGLRFIKKLIDEELVSPLSLTQDVASEKALLASETTICGAFCQAGPSDIPADDIRRTQYVGIAPLYDKDGNNYAVYAPSTPMMSFFVTKDCKNPEAAFKLGDLLCSKKYSIMTRWGEENVDWLHPSEGDIGLYQAVGFEPTLVEVLPWGKLQNKHWAQSGVSVREFAIAAGVVWSGNELDTAPVIARAQYLYFDKHPEEFVTKLIYTAEEAEDISEIQSTLQSYVAECRAAFITGGMDIEKNWDSYLEQLKKIGVDTLIEYAQRAYDRMK